RKWLNERPQARSEGAVFTDRVGGCELQRLLEPLLGGKDSVDGPAFPIAGKTQGFSLGFLGLQAPAQQFLDGFDGRLGETLPKVRRLDADLPLLFRGRCPLDGE